MQYVTYESLFAFADLIFSAICAGASIITLVMTIVNMQISNSNCRDIGKNKRKK